MKKWTTVIKKSLTSLMANVGSESDKNNKPVVKSIVIIWKYRENLNGIVNLVDDYIVLSLATNPNKS